MRCPHFREMPIEGFRCCGNVRISIVESDDVTGQRLEGGPGIVVLIQHVINNLNVSGGRYVAGMAFRHH